jgi:hypothetical protein
MQRSIKQILYYILQNHTFITIFRKADVISVYIILMYYTELCWLFTPLLVSITIRPMVKCNQLTPFRLIVYYALHAEPA